MVYAKLGDYKDLIEAKVNYDKYYIAIDIGGTNTRVVFATYNGDYYVLKAFPCSNVISLINNLKDIEENELKGFNTPVACCIDLAGPRLSQYEIKLTNYHVDDCHLNITQLPKKICPPGTLYILNDLESGAYGIIPYIQRKMTKEIFCDFIHPLETKGPSSTGVYIVLAAGTGLGVGIIYYSAGEFKVIASEFGHISLVPLTPEEEMLFEKIKKYLPTVEGTRTNFNLEYEDLVSGRGIKYIFDNIKTCTRELTSAEIAKEANEFTGDRTNDCVRALTLHYKCLFRAAKETSVGLFSSGAFMIGDNIVRNKNFVNSIHQDLEDEFKNHPKLEWLSKIPVYVQKDIMNLNLIGCIYYATTRMLND